MKNFITKTIYQKHMFTLWWCIGLSVMIVLTLSFFPSLSKGGFDASFGSLPTALQNVVGDALSFRTIGGYVNQQLFALRLPMLGTVMSIVLFVGMTIGDEQRGLLESQLSLPIGRAKLLLQKLLACIAIMLVAGVAMILATMLGVFLVGQHYSIWQVTKAVFGCVLLVLDFGLVAAALGAAVGKKGLAIGGAGAFAFGGYLLSSMGSTIEGLKPFEKLSLFHYYPNGAAVTGHNITVLATFGLILILIGTVGFMRRDLRV